MMAADRLAAPWWSPVLCRKQTVSPFSSNYISFKPNSPTVEQYVTVVVSGGTVQSKSYSFSSSSTSSNASRKVGRFVAVQQWVVLNNLIRIRGLISFIRQVCTRQTRNLSPVSLWSQYLFGCKKQNLNINYTKYIYKKCKSMYRSTYLNCDGS